MSTVAVPRVAGARRLEVPHIQDARGCLSAMEGRDVPFDVQRVYWVTAVPSGARRGRHAHRRISEMIVAVSGSFTVRCDDGDVIEEVALSAPTQALVLSPLVWRELYDFTRDAVCMVLASGPYDEDEYVRDRREFLRLAAAR